MPAKISAGNDCLRFPQVTGGNFPAPAAKIGEAFIVPVKSAFFRGKGIGTLPLSISKHFDQSNHLLLLKFLGRERTTNRPQLGLSHQDSQKLQQKVDSENYSDLSLLVCNISKNFSA